VSKKMIEVSLQGVTFEVRLQERVAFLHLILMFCPLFLCIYLIDVNYSNVAFLPFRSSSQGPGRDGLYIFNTCAVTLAASDWVEFKCGSHCKHQHSYSPNGTWHFFLYPLKENLRPQALDKSIQRP